MTPRDPEKGHAEHTAAILSVLKPLVLLELTVRVGGPWRSGHVGRLAWRILMIACPGVTGMELLGARATFESLTPAEDPVGKLPAWQVGVATLDSTAVQLFVGMELDPMRVPTGSVGALLRSPPLICVISVGIRHLRNVRTWKRPSAFTSGKT